MRSLRNLTTPPLLIVSRPMRGGHQAVLRFSERFDRRDKAETERVRQINVELARLPMDLASAPDKCPEIQYDEVLTRLDPGFDTLMRKPTQAVDLKGSVNLDC